MIASSSPPTGPTAWAMDPVRQRSNIRRISILLGSVTLLGGAFTFYGSAVTGIRGLIQVALVLLLIGAASMLALLFSWRGRTQLGGWLIIGGLSLSIPVLSSQIANLGVPLAIASLLLIPTITSFCLPGQSVQRASILGLTAAALSLIFNFYGPADKLSLPAVATFAPYLDVILLILLGLAIAGRFRGYPLRTKLIVAFLAVALLPIALLAYLNDRAARSALTDQANQKLFAAATQMSATLDAFVQANLNDVRTEAQLRTIEDFMAMPAPQRANSNARRTVSDILNVLKRKDVVNIATYGLLELDGTNILDTDPELQGMDESGRDYFQIPLDTGLPYVSYVQIPMDTEVPSIYFSAPVRDTAGQIVGVLRVRFRASVFQRMLVQNLGLAGEESFAVLFDEQHIHLAHTTAPETIMRTVGPLTPEVAAALQEQNRLPDRPLQDLSTNLPELEDKLTSMEEFPFFEAEDVATGSRTNQVAITTMTTKPWLVAFLQPQDILFAPIEAQTRNILLLAFVIAGGVALAAAAVSQLLAAPISRLTHVATRIAEGDLTAQASETTPDEIGTLAMAFNSMTARLRDLILGLEERVAERTQDLERRANQLQAAAEIAKDAAGIRDVDRLLNEAVALISERFGYYHAGVFLVDETGDQAVLRSSSSEAGQKLIENGHSLAVGKVGIVGYVTGTGKPRVSHDVREDGIHYANPNLPTTRSEMALPLSIGTRVIGALDVQSEEPRDFPEDDVIVLRTMADQLAIAIENTRLLTSQTRVASLRSRAIEAYRNLTQQLGYDALIESIAGIVCEDLAYDRVSLALVEGGDLVVRGSAAADGFVPAQVGARSPLGQGALGRAAISREPVSVDPDASPAIDDLEGQESLSLLAVPLISHGSVAGTLSIERRQVGGFDADEIEVAELLANQIAVSIENARLLEETESSLRQVDALYRQQAAEAWAQLMASQVSEEKTASFEAGRAAAMEEESLAHQTPIAVRGEVIGQFTVEGIEHSEWDEEELGILEAVAEDLADHLEQVRLMQEVRRRATQIETAAEIARVATGVLDLGTLLSRVVNLIRDRFNYYHVSVFLMEPESNRVELREATGEAGERLKQDGFSIPIGSSSIVGHVTESGESYVAHDTESDRVYAVNELLPDTRSELCVPIKIGETSIGVLDVQHSRPFSFGSEEIAVLEALADQLAVAIQNARLFQETLNRAEREKAVVEITSKIRASSDIDSMLKTAVAEIRRTLGARVGRIRLIAGDAESQSSGRAEPPDAQVDGRGRLESNGRPDASEELGGS